MSSSSTALRPDSRLSQLVLAACLAGAVPLLVYFGRHQWFFLDEWEFLANRSATSPDDLLRPHNEHWTTVPVLIYRAMWSVVGLQEYWPYQLLVIGLHLLVAVLLRQLIRRVGLGPWLSTVMVVPFVLFGSGVQNILWAFQISFVGALAAGLGHLLLADRDSATWDRRDWWALGVGALGLTFSGLAVPLTVGVGVAVWLRRGLAMAGRHTVPLGVVYLVWWVSYGAEGYSSDNLGLGDALEFSTRALRHTVGDIGRLGGDSSASTAGLLVAVVVVAGMVLWFNDHREQWRTTAAATIGCAAALVVLLGLTGFGRAELGVPLAEQSRYSHVVFALLIPAAGLAAAGYGGRWSRAGWVVAATLLIGLPGNIAAFSERDLQRQIEEGQPELVLALPRLPEGQAAPADARPLPTFGYELTMGWLRAETEAGAVPEPDTISESVRRDARFRLSLVQRQGEVDGVCEAIDESRVLRLEPGSQLGIKGGLVLFTEVSGSEVIARVSFFPDFGGRIDVEQGPLDVEVMAGQEIRGSELCLTE